MNGNSPNDSRSSGDQLFPAAASELNNLLQIASGTVAMLENVCEGAPGSEKYFQMLRTSLDRAARVTAQLVQHVGGTEQKILFHPALATQIKARPAPRAALKISRCILVVDDEPMALSLAGQILSDAGFTVVTTQSGFDALDLFQKDPSRYSLVLLDLSMPFMDGEETFNRLRAIDPHVVVLLNTGFVEKARLDRMMKDGLAGFLRRPYQPREVIDQIEVLLANAATRLRQIVAAPAPAPTA
ncbi:MAG TPA: response regulator [Chthoniobacterales bacterium]|jgi:CheY-like chemotaxis protein|nr:response regulator [Chthoniobacterales bacterium]